MGFRGSNASGGGIVLLPGAFWAHGASKMAILDASLLLCILQCFGASEGMLPPGACRSSRASARRIVSCKGLCASSLCPQNPHAPAPTFGAFRRMFLRKSTKLGGCGALLSYSSQDNWQKRPNPVNFRAMFRVPPKEVGKRSSITFRVHAKGVALCEGRVSAF